MSSEDDRARLDPNVPDEFLRRKKTEVHGFQRHGEALKLAKYELQGHRAKWEDEEAEQRGKLIKKSFEDSLNGIKDDWDSTVGKSKDVIGLGKNLVKFVMGFKFLHGESEKAKEDSETGDSKHEPGNPPDEFSFHMKVQGTSYEYLASKLFVCHEEQHLLEDYLRFGPDLTKRIAHS
jgi:hypothetical protein